MRILLVMHECNSPYNVLPYGIAYLASIIRNQGHSVIIYDMATTHHNDEELFTFIINEKKFDFIGMGFQAAYFHIALKTSKAIKAACGSTPFVLGGSAPSASPIYILKKFDADYLLIGECEDSIIKFLNLIESKANSGFNEVNGLYWKKDNQIFNTKKGPPPDDLDALPFPAWDLFDMKSYTFPRRIPGINNIVRAIGMLTSRGCPYSCKFCFRLENKYRKRSIENCIEEIEYLIKKYHINYIRIHDDLFMVSKERTLLFCEKILEKQIKFNWGCNGRFNIADREQLRMMNKAGCILVAYGLESGDQKILDEMDKKITVEQIYEISKITKEEGMLVSVPSMIGLPNEDENSVNKTVNAIIGTTSWHDKRTLRPMQPYPGSYYFDYCIEKGLLKDEDDFYSRYFSSEKKTVNLSNIPDSIFDKVLYNANQKLLKKFYEDALKSDLEMFQKVYFENDSKNFIPLR